LAGDIIHLATMTDYSSTLTCFYSHLQNR